MSSILIHSGSLVTKSGLEEKDIFIEDGLIRSIGSPQPPAPQTLDASGLFIFPGLVDCHVHFREPGEGDAEDMESGAAAARSGGVTTVCDMPNTNPPTCTRGAFADKCHRAGRIRGCDIRFFFGVTKAEHLRELEEVLGDDGLRRKLCGVKLYFGHSTGNQKVEDAVTEDVFRFSAEHDLPLVCHCEDEEIIQKNMQRLGVGESKNMRLHSEIRSVAAAVRATERAIGLARKHGTALHIAHVSTGDEIGLIRKAKAEGCRITCEVAPHHLFLTEEDYETLGTLGKMNPPLRSGNHGKALWEGIADHTVDCIATDHAPHTLGAKGIARHAERSDSPQRIAESKHWLEAPSGVPGVATMLPLLLSCLSSGGPKDAKNAPRVLTSHESLLPEDLLRLLFTRPNEIFRLGKPGVTLGKPVDIILVNPKKSWKINGKDLGGKCGWTPYEGWRVQGRIMGTVVGGNAILADELRKL